jgi:hypothetical protein
MCWHGVVCGMASRQCHVPNARDAGAVGTVPAEPPVPHGGGLAPVVDAGAVLPDLSCVAVAVPLGDGQMAAVSALVAGMRPPIGLLAAT